jgi:amino acid transporter
LIAVLVVGIVAIAVMEGICELINLWPIPNAMVEYVRAFVDEDLGVAIGILYWSVRPPSHLEAEYSLGCRYTYTVSFSALIIVAGDLTDYWAGAGEETLPYVWKGLIYAVVPWLILCLNAAPVDVSSHATSP